MGAQHEPGSPAHAAGAVEALKANRYARSAVAAARRGANLGAQVRAAARRGAAVVYYHRVVDDGRDPFQLSVSTTNFAEHLAVLGASGRPLLTFAGLVEALHAGRVPARAVVVSFDDGYADNALTAVPLLEQAGVPATVFVTIDSVEGGTELWWDALERIFLVEPAIPERFDMVIGGERVSADVAGEGPVDPGWLNHQPTTSARAGLFLDVWHQMLGLGVDERDDVIAGLFDWAGCSRAARPERRIMTTPELLAMAASPAVEVGCHTFRHPNLTLPNDLTREVVESRSVLADMIGCPVRTFSYPNGYHDARSVAAVHQAGYRGACTTELGVVTSGTDPFTVPRYHVPDVGGDAFARFLRALG